MMRRDPPGFAHSCTDRPVVAAGTASRRSQEPSAVSLATRPEGVSTTMPSTAVPPVPPVPPPTLPPGPPTPPSPLASAPPLPPPPVWCPSLPHPASASARARPAAAYERQKRMSSGPPAQIDDGGRV